MANRSFKVFGETVEVLVDGQTSNGVVAALTQTCPPGGGPPPHTHSREDETFTVLDGKFEMFNGTGWRELNHGEVYFAPRGGVHTFRNCGAEEGKILIVCNPAGMETYLEQISRLSIPEDLEKLDDISGQFGIRFVR